MSVLMIPLLALLCTANCHASAENKFNLTPFPPPNLEAHFFLFADGTVPAGPASNRLANNAVEGTPFLRNILKLTTAQIASARQEAITYWKNEFGLDGNSLSPADGSVSVYQLAPALNERIHLITTPCQIPPEGFRVLDGGFQLLVTNPQGVTVINPKTLQPKTYPQFTNLVFSYLVIQTTTNGSAKCNINTCGKKEHKDIDIPPAAIIVPYKTKNADFVLSTTSQFFDLLADEGNYFGCGQCSGFSAPVDNGDTITNRLSNYCTFSKNVSCTGNRTAIWRSSRASHILRRY